METANEYDSKLRVAQTRLRRWKIVAYGAMGVSWAMMPALIVVLLVGAVVGLVSSTTYSYFMIDAIVVVGVVATGCLFLALASFLPLLVMQSNVEALEAIRGGSVAG
jgi:hypothetical protein